MNKFRKWIQKHGKTILIIILVIMLFMSYGEYNSLKENFIEYQHEIEVYYAGMQCYEAGSVECYEGKVFCYEKPCS